MGQVEFREANGGLSLFNAMIEIVFQRPRHRLVERHRAIHRLLIRSHLAFVGRRGGLQLDVR